MSECYGGDSSYVCFICHFFASVFRFLFIKWVLVPHLFSQNKGGEMCKRLSIRHPISVVMFLLV